MKKYYIEIYKIGVEEYIVQSQWFDNKDEAKEWANKIDFLEGRYGMDLMSSKFADDECGDIEKEEALR